MRAAVVTSLDQSLELWGPIPCPVPVRSAYGSRPPPDCATPTSSPPTGDRPVKPTLPFMPGHEGVGIVDAVGPAALATARGTRQWPETGRRSRGFRVARPLPTCAIGHSVDA
jgi:alcohol dehydrogenase, propanol-preferring